MPVPHEYVTKAGRKTYKVRFRLHGHGCQETFDTLKEARAFCSDIETRDAAYAVRVLAEQAQATGGLTVAELAERFLAWKENDPDVRSDRTVADYRRDYRKWIGPAFGDRPARLLHERDVQEWVDAMSAGTLGHKPIEPKTIGDKHMVLSGMYSWGMSPARRLVDHNPCTSTRLPKRRRKPAKGLRPAEWQALHAALVQIDRDAADLAEMLLASGWRVSEAGALSAFDVEDDGQTMHVTMTHVLRRNAAGQHVRVEDAKSAAGEGRRIKLDAETAGMVRRRLERVTGDGLVFTTANGSQWHHANFLNRYWNKAVKAANLTRRPTPHWLRHTSVAWLVMSGKTSLPEIQRRIGHENISTTIDVYGRMIDDVSDDALDAFAAMRRATPRPAIRPAEDPPRSLDTGPALEG